MLDELRGSVGILKLAMVRRIAIANLIMILGQIIG